MLALSRKPTVMLPRDTPLTIAVLASGEGTNLQVLLDAQREERLPIRVVGVFGDKPAARLVPLQPAGQRRVPGRLRGRIAVGPEFFEPLPEEELAAWEGR